ncbi:MAG: hypothetical protein ACFFCW_40080 [Candidatus Hodarchaeota archaeon]
MNKRPFPALVVDVIDNYTIVINRGSQDGVHENQKFLVYQLSEKQLTDPETGELLGLLEIVKGTGIAVHVQEKMTTIRSDQKTPGTRRVIRQAPDLLFGRNIGEVVEEYDRPELHPFEGIKRGDKVKIR